MIYQIVTAASIEELIQKVNEKCAHDWSPTGGVISYFHTAFAPERGRVFSQAMICFDTQPPASGEKLQPNIDRLMK
jgi:hypothetical protein